jgi:hypothetical protein
MSEALSLLGKIPLTSDSDRVMRARILDALQGRQTGIALASATRTITTQSTDISTVGYRSVLVWLSISNIGATGLRVVLRARDPVSGGWASLASSGTQSTTGLSVASFGPGSSAIGGGGSAPNLGSAGCYLSQNIRIEGSAIGTDPITYSIGYELCA